MIDITVRNVVTVELNQNDYIENVSCKKGLDISIKTRHGREFILVAPLGAKKIQLKEINCDL